MTTTRTDLKTHIEELKSTVQHFEGVLERSNLHNLPAAEEIKKLSAYVTNVIEVGFDKLSNELEHLIKQMITPITTTQWEVTKLKEEIARLRGQINQ